MESRSVRLSVIILLVSLLVSGMLLLAACGGASKKTAVVPGSTGAAAPTTNPGTLTPKYGGILRITSLAVGANIGWPATVAAGGAFAQTYYETLLRSEENGTPSGCLAESYKVAGDKKSITFVVRRGVKFSDGSDLTADVVKWNLGQFVKSEPNWTSIEVVDPNTVRVNFKTWDNSIPDSFSDAGGPTLYMVSKVAYDKNGQEWMTSHPVGTGAFTVESYRVDTSMKLVKNPNYWAKDAKGDKLPYLDGLEFTFTADPTTELMMAKAGETDMALTVSQGKQLADYKKIGWSTNYRYDSNEVWIPDSAHQDSPWSKQEVREAAEYAVDRATIAEKFGYGYLKAPNQIPPRDATAYEANFASARSYDPAKAKELLTQAGYPNGFKTTLIVWPGGSRDIALAEQQYLLAVGIRAEVQFADMAKFASLIGPQGTYHNALLEAPAPASGATGLGCVSFVLSNFGSNWRQPAEFTKAYEAATSSATPDVELVRAATDILTKNALVIPVWERGSGRVQQSYVVANFGKSSTRSSLETAWLNK